MIELSEFSEEKPQIGRAIFKILLSLKKTRRFKQNINVFNLLNKNKTVEK